MGNLIFHCRIVHPNVALIRHAAMAPDWNILQGMEEAMVYLDVNPVMESLRTMPEDFRLRGKWLSHRRSQHDFGFNPDGKVVIRAACACADFMVKPEQERALYDGFREWEASYWHPLS